MTDATPADFQRLLASEFAKQGWEYDMTVGADLVTEIERQGFVDPAALAMRIPQTWLAQQRATRDGVREAIERATGGRVPKPAKARTTRLTINNQSYTLTVAPGGQITGSQVNVGGTQVNVRAETSKEEVLAGVVALVRAGLAGDWNVEAARELAAAIDARTDIGVADVEGPVAQLVDAEPPEPGRVRQMLESISEHGLGGALATGISAAVGAVLRNPPF